MPDETPVTRQLLMKMIDGRIPLTPDFERRRYTFRAPVGVGTLIVGMVPNREQPLSWVWRARRESNPRPTGSKPVALSS